MCSHKGTSKGICYNTKNELACTKNHTTDKIDQYRVVSFPLHHVIYASLDAIYMMSQVNCSMTQLHRDIMCMVTEPLSKTKYV